MNANATEILPSIHKMSLKFRFLEPSKALCESEPVWKESNDQCIVKKPTAFLRCWQRGVKPFSTKEKASHKADIFERDNETCDDICKEEMLEPTHSQRRYHDMEEDSQ